jgi:hypothetical protein
VSEDRPLNPPILGDFELRKVVNSPKAWPELVEGLGAGGRKTLSSRTKQVLDRMVVFYNANKTKAFLIRSIPPQN